jgi:hypothetical protein
MDAWRRTVVVPPRTPSPEPVPKLLDPAMSGAALSSFLPALMPRHQSSAYSTTRMQIEMDNPQESKLREPLEVLYANRLLESLSSVDIESLYSRGIIQLTHLAPSTRLVIEGGRVGGSCSHALVLVRGSVVVSKGRRQLALYDTPGDVLLEKECLMEDDNQEVALLSMSVSENGGPLTAWAVPRAVIRRITAARGIQRRLQRRL